MNKQKKKKTHQKTKKLDYKKIVIGLSSVLATLYPIINYVYNTLYQIKCEKFFGIPGKYFHDSVDRRLIYLGCIIVFIGMCALPLIIKRYDEKDLRQKKIFNMCAYVISLIFGMYLGWLNIDNWQAIMKQAYKKDSWIGKIVNFLSDNSCIMILIIVLGSLALFGITCDFINIKNDFARKFTIKMFAIAFSLSFTLMFFGVICRLSINIENQTKYELALIQEQSYAVLAEDDEKILVVSYIKTENEDYVLDTRNYYFFEKYQGSYQYVYMDNPPKIIKQT